jgi:ribonuclease P/MRP protein subunit POP5
MRHLPKHLRPRWRYLAVGLEAWPDAAVDERSLQRALWYAAQNLLGDPGSADLDLTVVRFRFEGRAGEAVVRIRRGERERARAVVACVDAVDGVPIRTRVRGISGTVRACEERYIRRPRKPTHQRTVAFEDADRPAWQRGERVDVRVDDGFAGATSRDL